MNSCLYSQMPDGIWCWNAETRDIALAFFFFFFGQDFTTCPKAGLELEVILWSQFLEFWGFRCVLPVWQLPPLLLFGHMILLRLG